MFKKLNPEVRIRGALNPVVLPWITDKKIISNSDVDMELSHDFNTVQLHTHSHIDLYNLNKHIRWK